MDVFREIHEGNGVIKTVDMHTSGEPTRIVVSGYPKLEGDTLLLKRRYVRDHLDHFRKQLMLEPRGHEGMYGAILVQETELTTSGEADIGVLFCHNEGYSTMCGHATIALGQFLVDTHDENVFPTRSSLPFSPNTGVTEIRLHAPCGVVRISVPTSPDGQKADSSKPVKFISVPSFAQKRNVLMNIRDNEAWKSLQLHGQRSYQFPVHISYGGAFYAIVSVESLGFGKSLDESKIEEYEEAARCITSQLQTINEGELFKHPTENDVSFLYGVIITEETTSSNDETGLCFFAGSQIDRSPTGSGVCARVALAVKEDNLKLGEWRTYESLWSKKSDGDGFKGRGVERLEDGSVLVEVKGRSFYTGASSFVVPRPDDVLGSGFRIEK